MVPKEKKEKLPVAANLEENLARIDAALARNMAMIKSLRGPSTLPQRAVKTEEELDAEDREFLQHQSAIHSRAGLGAPTSADIKNGLANRKEFSANNKLRQVLAGRQGLQASKARSAEEKAASQKRAKLEDSEDEEVGRSSLGRAKKTRSSAGHVTQSQASLVEEQQLDIDENSADGKDLVGEFNPAVDGSSAQAKSMPSPVLATTGGDPVQTLLPNGKGTSTVSNKDSSTSAPTGTAPRQVTSSPTTTSSIHPSPKSEWDIPDDSETPPAATLSSHSVRSISRSSAAVAAVAKLSTDSEPSDIEVAIPGSITSNPSSFKSVVVNGSAEPVEAKREDRKREKRRLKRVRTKERQKIRALQVGGE